MGIALSPRVTAYEAHELDDVLDWGWLTTPTRSMQAAISAGWYSDSAPIEPTRHECSTSHCSWPRYSSLAVCGDVAIISSRLKIEGCVEEAEDGRNCSIAVLPAVVSDHLSDPIVVDDFGTFAIRSLTPVRTSDHSTASFINPTQSVAFDEISAPMADLFVIFRDDLGIVQAIEASLHFCTQIYATTVTNGVATSKSLFNQTNGFMHNGDALTVTAPDNAEYTVGAAALSALTSYFRLDGTFTTNPSTWDHNLLSQTPTSIATVLRGAPDTRGALNGMRSLIDGVAEAMTVHIRRGGEKASGQAWTQRTYLVVQWQWLVPLAAVVLLGTTINLGGMVLLQRY